MDRGKKLFATVNVQTEQSRGHEPQDLHPDKKYQAGEHAGFQNTMLLLACGREKRKPRRTRIHGRFRSIIGRPLTYTPSVCIVENMTKTSSAVHRRLNITLPEETVRLIDRVAKKGDRSRFIAEAVERYVAETGRANLKKRLKEGALHRADRDLQLATDWFGIEEEAWHGSRR